MSRDLHKSLGTIYRKHYQEFCLLSYSYVSCPNIAQDIVQDIFVTMLSKVEEIEITNLKGYIWNSVKYASIKEQKRLRKLAPLQANSASLTIVEDEKERDMDLTNRLQTAINKLPKQCKVVFELCALEGQKYQYAANSLGISVNTVKTQMKKAYKVLRYNLSDLEE